MNKEVKFLKTSLLNLIKAFADWVLQKQLYLTLVCYVIFAAFMVISDIPDNIKLVTIIIGGCVEIIGLCICLEYKRVEMKEQLTFPMFKKRFTHRIGGNVYVKPEEWQDAIVYLNYVEDFMENLGVYNKGE